MKRWTLLLAIVASFGLTGCEQLFEWMYGEDPPHPTQPCERFFDPVCGADGITYGNECNAHQAGVRIVRGGPCEDVICDCDMEYDPVCDGDGMLYPSPCEARCVGVYRFRPCSEPPPHGPPGGGWGGSWGNEECVCPEYNDPVCTPDGREFGNPCFAHCEGFTDLVDCHNGRRR